MKLLVVSESGYKGVPSPIPLPAGERVRVRGLSRMKLLAILISGYWLLATGYCQEVDIGITKQRLTKIKIGVNEFPFRERLIKDLILVDYFEPTNSTMGVDLILNCTVTQTDQLVIEGKLYEAKKGQMILGKRFSGPRDQYRKLIHSLTDSIITAVTGEKGICETRLTFEGPNKQIFTSDYDGENIIQLTKDPCINLFPNWSPNGDRIVYTSYLYNFPQTFIYNIKEGTRNRISGFPGLNTSASFSPNGQRIALTLSKDGNPEIYIINTDGTGLHRITNDKSIDSSPCWSPDGRRLAFVSNRGGSPQIYIIDINGGTTRRITYTGSYNTNPSWSPKGNIIVYNSLIGGSFQICTVDVATGETTQITSLPGSCENPSFAPDGRHIVFSLTKGYNSTLYIVDIFFREPHKLEMGGANYTNPDWR